MPAGGKVFASYTYLSARILIDKHENLLLKLIIRACLKLPSSFSATGKVIMDKYFSIPYFKEIPPGLLNWFVPVPFVPYVVQFVPVMSSILTMR